MRLTANVRNRRERGLTLVELIVAFTIMLLLTTMSVPLARAKVRRERERELRYALREIRTAIDKYKDMADAGMIPPGNSAPRITRTTWKCWSKA